MTEDTYVLQKCLKLAMTQLDNITNLMLHDVHLMYGKGQKVGTYQLLHNPSQMQREAKHNQEFLEWLRGQV
jgi:hypothetical protein